MGSIKTISGDCTREIKRSIFLAREKAVKLDTIWTPQHITRPPRVRLMKSLVWSIFLYGAESWTIERSDRNSIYTAWSCDAGVECSESAAGWRTKPMSQS